MYFVSKTAVDEIKSQSKRVRDPLAHSQPSYCLATVNSYAESANMDGKLMTTLTQGKAVSVAYASIL